MLIEQASQEKESKLMKNGASNKRIAAFDVAKFIGILAVFIGHTQGIPSGLLNFVFSFHMPLFS